MKYILLLLDAVPDVNRNQSIEAVANILRTDILEHYKDLPEISWPPSVEELNSDARKPPESVILLLRTLMKSERHGIERSEQICRLIDSYAQDLVHGVTRGSVITAKHFLVALGLHNMTGQRNVVEINNKLGHCISYPLTCEIETAQAQATQQNINNGNNILPVKPKTADGIVLTTFWVDNFDVKIDRLSNSSVNTTHMVAFQEVTESSFRSVNRINISRNYKSRKIATNNQEKTTVIIEPKKDPPHFTHTPYPAYNDKHFNSLYFVWCFLRKMNSKDQAVSSFSGRMLQLYTKCKEQSDMQKTIETYLPPINSKVTDFNTIAQYMILPARTCL